jgi:uncharacterized protein DUF5989
MILSQWPAGIDGGLSMARQGRSRHVLARQETVGGGEMKRLWVPILVAVVILVGLALLTEGSAVAPFLYRNF